MRQLTWINLDTVVACHDDQSFRVYQVHQQEADGGNTLKLVDEFREGGPVYEMDVLPKEGLLLTTSKD